MTKHRTTYQPAAVRASGGRHVAVLSRRTFVTATGTLLVTAGGIVTASVGFEHTDADASQTTGSPAAAALVAAAASTVGRQLANSAWQVYFGNRLTEWNTAWVEWLLKGAGAPKTNTVAALYSWAQRHGAVDGTARAGSLVFYFAPQATVPMHVGVVESVTKGVAQTIEGGSPANFDPAHQFVRRYSAPWSSTVKYVHVLSA
jgi:hypothetical protein